MNLWALRLQHCVLVISKEKTVFAFESRLSAVTQIICPIKLLIRECLAMLYPNSRSPFFSFPIHYPISLLMISSLENTSVLYVWFSVLDICNVVKHGWHFGWHLICHSRTYFGRWVQYSCHWTLIYIWGVFFHKIANKY